MSFQINAAIQLLPLGLSEGRWDVIDKAIALIAASGLKHIVCPFETVVEGSSDKVYALIQAIQETTIAGGCSEVLINVKIHAANRDLQFSEKLEKY
jgi:uncharacterized protein YqgV (UPF0045/DUF77 family)